MSLETVCRNLTAAERDEIVRRFTAANPRWRGAQCADILDTLDNTDSNLDAVEPAWDKYPALHKPGFGVAVRALVWSGGEVTGEAIERLLQ